MKKRSIKKIKKRRAVEARILDNKRVFQKKKKKKEFGIYQKAISTSPFFYFCVSFPRPGNRTSDKIEGSQNCRSLNINSLLFTFSIKSSDPYKSQESIIHFSKDHDRSPFFFAYSSISISSMPSFRYRTLLFLFLLVFFETFAAAVFGHQRSLLRSLGEGNGLKDYAIDLNSSTFESILKESPASFAIVEFFAHWCPACRNYKPHYEKVARLFNGPNAVHPGIVLMTRVDCAMKVNTNLCDKFSVGHYPMLLWGPPSKFTSSGWDPKQEKSEIKSIDDARTAERLLNWINKKIGSSFTLDDEKYDNENTLPWNATDPEEIGRAIYDVEEATSQLFEIITGSKRIRKETRAPLIKFFQLLIAHHPSKRCRKGTAEILVNFDELWPLDFSNNSQDASTSYARDVTKSSPICGKEVPRGYWIFCRGSRNETRGYSCGLWILLHSLSVRIGDGEAQLTFTVICDFVHNFFMCEECRRHFHEMCSSAPFPLNTTRTLVLWLWRSHNNVNERLMKEEKESGTADPRYPKMIWPPKELCTSCSISSSSKSGATMLDWNEDEVYKFIMNYYGSSLVSYYKDESITSRRKDESVDDVMTTTHAVSVPVGAALAIALASCAFGALACFWRTQQKNRKRKSSN